MTAPRVQHVRRGQGAPASLRPPLIATQNAVKLLDHVAQRRRIEAVFMEVDIDTSAGFRAGTPRSLFAGPPSVLDYGWDVAPDGKRFLLLATPGDGRTIPFTVMINWAAALKK